MARRQRTDWDAALDNVNALDRAQQFYGTHVDGGHVFHCSLSLSGEEGQLTDQQWVATEDDFMARARWAAVRRG